MFRIIIIIIIIIVIKYLIPLLVGATGASSDFGASPEFSSKKN